MFPEKLPDLMKELRKEVHNIKLKKLMRLDRSDRMLLSNRIRKIIMSLIEIQCIADAQCTVVLENYIEAGGEIRKPVN